MIWLQQVFVLPINQCLMTETYIQNVLRTRLSPTCSRICSSCRSLSDMRRILSRFSCVVYAESVKSCVVSITVSKALWSLFSVFGPTKVTRVISTKSWREDGQAKWLLINLKQLKFCISINQSINHYIYRHKYIFYIILKLPILIKEKALICTIYASFSVAYLAWDYAAVSILHLIRATHPEGKSSKKHMGLYQASNQQCQWVKIGGFTRCVTILHWYITAWSSRIMIYCNKCMTVCIAEPLNQ